MEVGVAIMGKAIVDIHAELKQKISQVDAIKVAQYLCWVCRQVKKKTKASAPTVATQWAEKVVALGTDVQEKINRSMRAGQRMPEVEFVFMNPVTTLRMYQLIDCINDAAGTAKERCHQHQGDS